MPPIRPIVALASLVALLLPGPAAAQDGDCLGAGLLLYENAVYTAELPLSAGQGDVTAEQLGRGRLAFFPVEGEETCDPRDVDVLALAEVGPDIAVAVAGRESIFVLGARCAGYEGDERLRCALAPLEYDGRAYTGAQGTAASELARGGALGEATLDGEPVAVVELESVDPAVGVGLDGRPGELFVAAGACPYERPDDVDGLGSDLTRCLRAPFWFVFELERPPAAQVGEAIVARSDRAVSEEVDGAAVSLVPIDGAADIVPDDLAGAVDVGRLAVAEGGSVALQITVPELPTGLYEAVVDCPGCESLAGGATTFPAGSLAVVGADEEGGSGPRTVGIVLGVLLVVLTGLAILAWRKGWYRPFGGRRRAT
jgi:hypothetical protein